MAVHRISQKQLPLILIGAGLPQLVGLAGKAKSYAERLFDYPVVDALSIEDAALALREPARREGVAFNEDALALVTKMTKGYPYFVQEWGYHSWNAADASPITIRDVHAASDVAIANLDKTFSEFDLIESRRGKRITCSLWLVLARVLIDRVT
jgi:hypothetical protein